MPRGQNDPRANLKRWLRRRFDLHFVPLVEMGEQLREVGYEGYDWQLPGSGWFGYVWAHKLFAPNWMIKRFNGWHDQPEGWCKIALEIHDRDVKPEVKRLWDRSG